MSWRKPVTFGLSFGLTCLTLGWLLGFVRSPAAVRGHVAVAADS